MKTVAIAAILSAVLVCCSADSSSSTSDISSAAGGPPSVAGGNSQDADSSRHQPDVNMAVDADVALSDSGVVDDIGTGSSPCATQRPTGTINIALGKGYSVGSHGFPSANGAFDGLSTDTGTAVNTDGILALDFGSVMSLGRTLITFRRDTAPRYKIQGSNDAASWTDVLRVHNPNYIDERLLPSASYRYLRFVFYQNSATGEDPNLLSSISEIEVYERAPRDPAGCPPIVYPVPVVRSNWKAFTNNGVSAQGSVSSPQQGWCDPHGSFDGPDTWVEHAGLAVGSYLAVDMGSTQTFNQIYMSSDHVPMDDYKIYVSDDGSNWGNPIASGSIVPTGGYEYAPVDFPLQKKRYFKIESDYDSHGKWWGFSNVSALNTTGASQIDESDKVNLALNRPTKGSTGGDASTVFDGNPATGIDEADVVAVDLGMSANIARIKMTLGTTGNGFTYSIETSNDGDTWVPRQLVSLSTLFAHSFDSMIMANYTTRFLRFTFPLISLGTHNVRQSIKEIEVYKTTVVSPVGRGQN